MLGSWGLLVSRQHAVDVRHDRTLAGVVLRAVGEVDVKPAVVDEVGEYHPGVLECSRGAWPAHEMFWDLEIMADRHGHVALAALHCLVKPAHGINSGRPRCFGVNLRSQRIFPQAFFTLSQNQRSSPRRSMEFSTCGKMNHGFGTWSRTQGTLNAIREVERRSTSMTPPWSSSPARISPSESGR